MKKFVGFIKFIEFVKLKNNARLAQSCPPKYGLVAQMVRAHR